MIQLREGDLMIYERNTKFARFMRDGNDIHAEGTKNRIDLGDLRIEEARMKADELGSPYGLVAELTNEKQEMCIFRFKRPERH